MQRPAWTVATEDFGEGIFLQLDEDVVAQWEQRVSGTPLWAAHKEAHRRNFANRNSETAEDVNPDSWLRPPRYWLVHTLAHVLIRTLAMSCGYSAASLAERLYAWPPADGRPASAGLLICTTASDSDGTLGGLVQQSEPDRLNGPSSRHFAGPGAAPLIRSALPAPLRSPRTSCTARPVTAASWRRRPRASGPTGSSTAGSS